MFELPFVQWLEFIEVGFTPLCKMCSNLSEEGQMALASVWASFGSQWIQERINLMQQVCHIFDFCSIHFLNSVANILKTEYVIGFSFYP